MDMRPYICLPVVRAVNRPDLPVDLAAFYATNEGVGLESEPNQTVRLCQLDEVSWINGWDDLKYGIADPVPEGWEEFIALRIGMGITFEEIVYVIKAPSCPPGSIFVIGSSVCGPGGDGTGDVEGTLVLGASLRDWLNHLERWGGGEPVIMNTRELTEMELESLREYYLGLNPRMNIAST